MFKKKKNRVSRLVPRAYLLNDHATENHYAVLGVSQFPTKQEIKKKYRRLALDLHPDVCDGDHCSTQFQRVKTAYEALIQNRTSQFEESEGELSDDLKSFMGVGDDSWAEWEEWMGWEGAGTCDYTNHINSAI